jgi:hypothetical protein
MLLFLLLVTGIAVFYLLSSRNALGEWWFSLNPCFFRNGQFMGTYFTPDTKTAGNYFCLLGLLITILVIIRTALRLKRYSRQYFSFSLSYSGLDLLFIFLLLSYCTVMNIEGHRLVPIVSDEVLSGFILTRMHPFQLWAFYMLPNNHVLFNLANKFLFYPFADKAFTSKILSFIAYLSVIIILYTWLRNKLKGGRWSAFLVTGLIASQFTMWVYGFEGRGYEWQVFAAWVSLISIFEYKKTRSAKYVILFAFCSIMGFALVPSYLLIFTPLIVFAAFMLNPFKSENRYFWLFQFYTVAFTYLFYLPSLIFSGLGALSGNKYVYSTQTMWQYINREWPLRSYIDYCFSYFALLPSRKALVFCLAPIIMIFFPRKSFASRFGVFYVMMLAGFLILVVIIRKDPFHRNLTVHFCFVLFAFLCLCDYLINYGLQLVKFKKAFPIVAAIGALALGYHMVWTNIDRVGYNIYFGDIADFARQIDNATDKFPKNKTIGMTDDSYQWKYAAFRRNLKWHDCMDNNEDILVIQDDNPKPDTTNYINKGKVMDYTIYYKK